MDKLSENKFESYSFVESHKVPLPPLLTNASSYFLFYKNIIRKRYNQTLRK